MLDQRAPLLRAALGFLTLEPGEPELRVLLQRMDCWRGLGDVVTGMKRMGYEVSLGDHGSGQWIAVFYAGHGGDKPLEAAERRRKPRPGGRRSGQCGRR